MLHMVLVFVSLTYAVNLPFPQKQHVLNSNTVHIYAWFLFFPFGGMLLGLFAKGVFLFFAAVVFFAEQQCVQVYKQWNMQVQSIVSVFVLFYFFILNFTSYLCQN